MGRKERRMSVIWMIFLTLTTGVLWVPFYFIAKAKKEERKA